MFCIVFLIIIWHSIIDINYLISFEFFNLIQFFRFDPQFTQKQLNGNINYDGSSFIVHIYTRPCCLGLDDVLPVNRNPLSCDSLVQMRLLKL